MRKTLIKCIATNPSAPHFVQDYDGEIWERQEPNSRRSLADCTYKIISSYFHTKRIILGKPLSTIRVERILEARAV